MFSFGKKLKIFKEAGKNISEAQESIEKYAQISVSILPKDVFFKILIESENSAETICSDYNKHDVACYFLFILSFYFSGAAYRHNSDSLRIKSYQCRDGFINYLKDNEKQISPEIHYELSAMIDKLYD